MPKYLCIKKCQMESIIEEGQEVTFVSEDFIPPSVRPYFTEVPTESQKEVEAEKKQEAKVRQDNVCRELDELGIAYSRSMGTGRLEEMLRLVKRDATGGSQTKPLDRMNKLELKEKADSLKIPYEEDASNGELREAILEKAPDTK